jgi:nucleotide-binding universal stress UspA family protein
MPASIDQPGTAATESPEDGGGRPRVVVGVDGSPGSRAALVHALIAAARRGADLDVVSSYGVELYYLGGEPLDVPNTEAIRHDHQARARAVVTEVRDELAVSFAPGIRDVAVTFLVSAGPAAQALLDCSEGAALLVVGSRGRGAMRTALLGSVALHCVTHAACPVVVVHPAAVDAGPSARVLVGVDGSDSSRAALAMAVDEAFRIGAEVEAVATYVEADYWTDLTSIVIPTVEEIRSEVEQRTRRLIDEVLAERRDRGEPSVAAVRTEVVEGSAAEVLVQRARSADLLVVGSRGRGAFRGLLLGSVALHCAIHAPCPVMVVHPLRSRSAAGTPAPSPAMADR